jgi:hypothetical protein
MIGPRYRAALRVWFAVVPACALGCAESSAPAAATAPGAEHGDPQAAPSLLALPQLPADGDTPRTHQGMLMARATLDAAMPAAPADRSFASLQRWVDGEVLTWLQQRRTQTLATRDRFLVGGEPTDAEHIVSLAVLALIDEDTARALGNLPPPSELDDEPDIAAMYRDVTRMQAEAFMSAAIVGMRDCANAAYREPSEWQAFARFCHARFDRLQQEREQHAAPVPEPAPVASATQAQ